MAVVAIVSPPRNLATRLREMADAVDRGDIKDFVCAYNESGGYSFEYESSLHSCLVLASLLWQNCIDMMRR